MNIWSCFLYHFFFCIWLWFCCLFVWCEFVCCFLGAWHHLIIVSWGGNTANFILILHYHFCGKQTATLYSLLKKPSEPVKNIKKFIQRKFFKDRLIIVSFYQIINSILFSFVLVVYCMMLQSKWWLKQGVRKQWETQIILERKRTITNLTPLKYVVTL